MYSGPATRRRRMLLANSSRAAGGSNDQTADPHTVREAVNGESSRIVVNGGGQRAQESQSILEPAGIDSEPATLPFRTDATNLPAKTSTSQRRELVSAAAQKSTLPKPFTLLSPSEPASATEITLTSVQCGAVETVRLDSPLVIVGRSAQCELRLTHPDVSRRHACLQLLRGRVLCVDLGSRTGVHWNEERRQSGWLDAERPVRIGPFELRLAGSRPSSAAPAAEVIDSEVLFRRHAIGDSAVARAGLRFLNPSKSQSMSPVSLVRPITLIGRGGRCRLRLRDESVSRVHSSLMVTPDGVWIADLLGRGGVRVNGEFVSLARLSAGDEIQIGRYRLAFVTDLAVASDAPESPESSEHVPQTAGQLETSGQAGGISESLLLAMTETFADMQRQMNEQFRYQMELMAGLVESMHKEMTGEIRQELARLVSIGEEIRDTQKRLAAAPAPTIDQATAASALPVPASAESPHDNANDVSATDDNARTSNGTVASGRLPRRDSTRFASTRGESDSGNGVADHIFMTRRLRELERERNSRWERLFGLLKGDA